MHELRHCEPNEALRLPAKEVRLRPQGKCASQLVRLSCERVLYCSAECIKHIVCVSIVSK